MSMLIAGPTVDAPDFLDAPAETQPAPRRAPRVVVAEDDAMLRELICKVMTRAGYSVAPASNGVEALHLIRENPPDLLLTDLIMPEKEGVEIIIEVRRLLPGLPIIAMSGGGRLRPDCYLAIASKLGAIRTLMKPFVIEDLLAAVKEALAAKQ